jgi:antitoxin MazE
MAAAVVRKWGNSAAVRIPATVLADANLQLDQPVEVRGERGRIVIERLRPAAFKIDQLVNGIRRDNLHEAVDTGVPVGSEAW